MAEQSKFQFWMRDLLAAIGVIAVTLGGIVSWPNSVAFAAIAIAVGAFIGGWIGVLFRRALQSSVLGIGIMGFYLLLSGRLLPAIFQHLGW